MCGKITLLIFVSDNLPSLLIWSSFSCVTVTESSLEPNVTSRGLPLVLLKEILLLKPSPPLKLCKTLLQIFSLTFSLPASLRIFEGFNLFWQGWGLPLPITWLHLGQTLIDFKITSDGSPFLGFGPGFCLRRVSELPSTGGLRWCGHSSCSRGEKWPDTEGCPASKAWQQHRQSLLSRCAAERKQSINFKRYPDEWW